MLCSEPDFTVPTVVSSVQMSLGQSHILCDLCELSLSPQKVNTPALLQGRHDLLLMEALPLTYRPGGAGYRYHSEVLCVAKDPHLHCSSLDLKLRFYLVMLLRGGQVACMN